MKTDVGCTMHNKYHLILTDSRTGTVKAEAVAYNLVCNQYYQNLNLKLNQSFTNPMSDIAVGTGTGTPAITDTGLFHMIEQKAFTRGPVIKLGQNQYSEELTVTFTENQANGLLTEVGVWAWTDYSRHALVSHAMLTDSEGHTITIEKTNTDRLTVVCTMYLTITLPSILEPQPFCPGFTYLSVAAAESANLQSIPYSSCPYLVRYLLGYTGTEMNDMGYLLSDGTYVYGAYEHQEFDVYHSPGTEGEITSTGYRISGRRVESTVLNLASTYQIKGLAYRFGTIRFPNHTLFPPKELTLEQAADGSTTDFNFGIPELMQSPVSVYIDNVLQDPSTYTWYGKDYTINPQAWISQSGKYLVEHANITAKEWSGVKGPCPNQFWSQHKMDANAYFLYDFGASYTVDTFKHTEYSSTANTTWFILEYSNDKETWTEAARITGSAVYGYKNRTITFSPISARYWRTRTNAFPSNYSYSDPPVFSVYVGAFDSPKPQLRFNTAPASGAVVRVVAKTEYPLKNSNWIIDQNIIDLSFSRGGNS